MKVFQTKRSAGIFRHQHGDSGIDADHVAVVPIFQRIEGIHETVLAPCAGSVASCRMVRSTRIVGCGKNGSEPAEAHWHHGAVDRALSPAGRPRLTYPLSESEAVMPHRSSL